MLTELSLFTGYGGFTLGLRLAKIPVKTICYVEIDKYRQEIIKARIRDGYLDDAPIWDDIRTFRGEQFRGVVDIITGGFPCQPHSVAGRRLGEADKRNLWPETARVIGEVAPRFVLLENVPGILSTGYALQVIGDLAEMGYDCVWGIVSAADVGANHLRKRWWVLAYTKHDGWIEARQSRRPRPLGEAQGYVCREGHQLSSSAEHSSQDVADSDKAGLSDREGAKAFSDEWQTIDRNSWRWWAVEPPLGRVAHGVADRVDRLKALGDGIVPAVVAEFFGRIGAGSR